MASWQAGHGETITGVLAESAAAHGDDVVLDFSGETYTYAEVDRQSSRLAHGLAALGVLRGDTVASILDNTVDAIFTWLAINKLGAISVPVNTAYKGEFLRHQLDDAGAALVIAESDYAARIFAVADGLSAVRTVLVRGAVPAADGGAMAVKPLADAFIAGNDAVFPINLPGDLAMLIYTSGTTGPSKGCMISHGYACNLARQSSYCIGRRPGDILWTALPLFHMNATTSVLSTMMAGGRAAIYPRFSLSGFWPDIERSGATIASLLGSMHPLIAAAPDNDSSKRCFGQLRVVGAAPFPLDLQQRWRDRFGTQVMGAAGYGLTEAAMVTYGPLEDKTDPSTSGKMGEEFDVIIVDDHDNPLPVGQSGEVLCRPKRPFVMFEGYWNRPTETLKIMRNLWLHTGDIGKFDETGEFHFVDRKKDYLRRRGENISSFEMESTFQRHPAIMDVAVHAVLSKMGEDDVKVTCVLREGADLTEHELCTWAIDHVPYFAIPRYIEFRADLPRNPTGKIMKYQLRDDGCTAATWDRETVAFDLKRR